MVILILLIYFKILKLGKCVSFMEKDVADCCLIYVGV